MNFLYFACVFLALVSYSYQIPKYENCTPQQIARRGLGRDVCAIVTCREDGTFAALGCALSICQPGKQIGTRPDNPARVYPNCCGGPICAN